VAPPPQQVAHGPSSGAFFGAFAWKRRYKAATVVPLPLPGQGAPAPPPRSHCAIM